MSTLTQDLRYAIRALRQRPGFTFVAIVTLALGIGANAAIFSVVEAVLIRPLPYQDPDRLVYIWEQNAARGVTKNVVGPANFMRWRERSKSFDNLAGFFAWTGTVTGVGEPERIPIGIVTSDFFQTLGAQASLGRIILPDDGREGKDDVVLLSHDYWLRRFGGDSGVIGRTIQLNGKPNTIIGVMAKGFRSLMDADLWSPFALTAKHREFRGRWMNVLARLKPGVTRDAAQAEMATIAAAIGTELPDFTGGWGVNVVPMREQLVGDLRPALALLYAAVCVVLLIAGGNLAHLLLARGTERQREMAVRSALGAPRGRLVRQLLTESVVLSLAGGFAGALVAAWAIEGFRHIFPGELARFTDVRMNLPILLFALCLSAVTGVVFGTIPALAATRRRIDPALREGLDRSGTGRGRLRLRNALVAAEVALSLILLVAAGLLLRSFRQLSSVDLGIQTENILSLDLTLAPKKYDEPAKVARFFEQAVDSVRGLPGVDSAGAMSWRLLGSGSATGYTVAGEPEAAPGQGSIADVRVVTPDLFATLRVPLLRGRGFTREDVADAPRRVIVNEALARRHWPGADPIGRRLSMSWGKDLDAEVIGVVGDVRLTSIDAEARDTLYWSEAQLPNDFMTIMVRCSVEPTSLVRAIKAQIAGMDPDVPVANVQTMEQIRAESLTSRRFTTVLLEIFAAVALALAAIGNYGVMAFSVERRTREIGIRMALGARARDVLLMVIRQGMGGVVVGLALGAAGAAAVSRFLAGMLFEVSPTDPAVFAAVSILLALVSLAACAIPARRAARVEPTIALRSE